MFLWMRAFKEIILPQIIATIDKKCIYGCSELTQINITDLIKIQIYSFLMILRFLLFSSRYLVVSFFLLPLFIFNSSYFFGFWGFFQKKFLVFGSFCQKSSNWGRPWGSPAPGLLIFFAEYDDVLRSL
jgi:hypothetical protein